MCGFLSTKCILFPSFLALSILFKTLVFYYCSTLSIFRKFFVCRIVIFVMQKIDEMKKSNFDFQSEHWIFSFTKRRSQLHVHGNQNIDMYRLCFDIGWTNRTWRQRLLKPKSNWQFSYNENQKLQLSTYLTLFCFFVLLLLRYVNCFIEKHIFSMHSNFFLSHFFLCKQIPVSILQFWFWNLNQQLFAKHFS